MDPKQERTQVWDIYLGHILLRGTAELLKQVETAESKREGRLV